MMTLMMILMMSGGPRRTEKAYDADANATMDNALTPDAINVNRCDAGWRSVFKLLPVSKKSFSVMDSHAHTRVRSAHRAQRANRPIHRHPSEPQGSSLLMPVPPKQLPG